MTAAPLGILILCTGNSCRSIMGEVLFNELGAGKFVAYSAGSHPAGNVNAGAIRKLRAEGHATNGLSSKSWDRFSGPDAPTIDIVITVCDSAAGEACPIWNANPVTVHWGIPDPANADDVDSAFDRSYGQLRDRVEQVLELPLDSMATRYRKEALQRIHDATNAREGGDD